LKKPNLFIVGVPKAATTFLFEKLKFHPDIYFPKIKELNHFSYDSLKARSYYKDYKVKAFDNYMGFYKSASHQKYLVDASVSYFAFSDVPAKIYNFNKDAKIIIVLRDPVKRAFSHYQMDKRMGYAKKSFLEYIANPQVYPSHYLQYVENSMYSKHIKNYYNVFSDDAILILQSTDLSNNIQKVFKFLNINEDVIIDNTSELINPNKTPKNFIARYFQNNRNVVSRLKLFIPASLIKKINVIFYASAKEEEMTAEEATYCYSLFKDDQEQLNNYIKN
jgi:hypothetical protein